MSEPKVAHIFDYMEYDLGKARDGNKPVSLIWNRLYVLKNEGEVYFRKEQSEKWIDLRLLRAIDISPDHHSYFYLKNEAQEGKELIIAIGRAFYTEPALAGQVLLMNKLMEIISPASHAKTPALYNVVCTVAGTEYDQALPANTKKFLIKARGGALKVCFTEGQSGTTYMELEIGKAYWEDLIEPESLTLYFQSPVAGTVAEIVVWS